MSSKTATLALKITGDARDANTAIDSADGKLSGFGKKLGGLGAVVGLGVGAAVGGLAVFGKAAFDAASDAEQSLGGINAVFGDWAIDIEQSADSAATAVGLSKNSYMELAAVIGSQLKGAGMPIDDVTSKTQGLVGMGADLAATFGGTTADAVSALSSVLKGETDPIERYGVSIKQADISARLAANGQDKLTGTALKTATANAALALVTEQTAAAHGQFAAQGDSAAEKAQKLSAWWENLKAKVGEGLLPIFGTLVDFFTTKLGPVFDDFTKAGGPLANALGKIGTFIKDQVMPALSSLWDELAPKLIPAWKQMGDVFVQIVVPAFQKVWDIVKTYVIPIIRDTLGPVIDSVRGVWGKLSDALNDNKDKFQQIYDNVQPLLKFLRDTVAPLVGGALKIAFEGLGKAIGPTVDAIAWILGKASAVAGVIGKLGNLFGGGSAPAGGGAKRGAMFGAAAGAGRVFGATSSLGSGAGPTAAGGLTVAAGDTYTVHVTVNGALDPLSVGAQLEDVLTRWLASTGRAPAVGGSVFG